ncbi:hypothetical protein [Vibrio sp. D431a]|uniref:hypothetical protein n=1 Tax=Vibrio sp. D431a TaxID=2837388 RepID=UPI002554E51D|nr:hypothetical protein [Vibrio sp. D431a]MDK9790186.1 hypothetical protein [Vibrio sp. D431a]
MKLLSIKELSALLKEYFSAEQKIREYHNYRLHKEKEQQERLAQISSLRSSVSEVILKIEKLGIDDATQYISSSLEERLQEISKPNKPDSIELTLKALLVDLHKGQPYLEELTPEDSIPLKFSVFIDKQINGHLSVGNRLYMIDTSEQGDTLEIIGSTLLDWVIDAPILENQTDSYNPETNGYPLTCPNVITFRITDATNNPIRAGGLYPLTMLADEWDIFDENYILSDSLEP